MTGFGRASATGERKKITVDVKSLNSKQLDLVMRVPSLLREFEIPARNEILALLERGKIELSVVIEDVGTASVPGLNREAMAAYKAEVEAVAHELGVNPPDDWFQLLVRMPEAFKTENADASQQEGELFMKTVCEAAEALRGFRLEEGRRLYSFFVDKIQNIGKLLDEVEPLENERVPKIRCRLEEQLSRLDSIEFDKGRLEQELIFYIEKLDITEEKTRLRSHLAYFLETLGGENEESVAGKGKKLGFIAQEIGREINTLGSKANHSEIQQIVVRMKDELEQIKEQVLNVL